MKKILCLGEANIDLIIPLAEKYTVKSTTDEILKKGETKENFEYQISETLGGAVFTVAMGISKLGGNVGFCGAVGEDIHGEKIRKSLTSHGIDATGVISVPAPTMMVLCLVDNDGDRDFRVYPPRGGAYSMLLPEHIDKDFFDKFDSFYTSGTTLYDDPLCDTILWAMEQFKNAGKDVIFDINLRTNIFGFTDYHKRIFSKAISLSTVVFGSGREELMVMSGKPDLISAAKHFATDGRVIVSKNGADGAFAVVGEEIIKKPALKVNIINTVGAGDMFNCGFITAYLQNLSISDCLIWGNASAGYSLMQVGSSSPYLADLQKLLP